MKTIYLIQKELYGIKQDHEETKSILIENELYMLGFETLETAWNQINSYVNDFCKNTEENTDLEVMAMKVYPDENKVIVIHQSSKTRFIYEFGFTDWCVTRYSIIELKVI